MFGIIPKPLWEKSNPADESNRVKLATRNLLLVSEDKKIINRYRNGKEMVKEII
ncbi:MAG: hypothetical protein MZV64_20180 [Ignavibacteriales bacterium]|nr:hypothetical protein [Ignavibacteriales bacterium]